MENKPLQVVAFHDEIPNPTAPSFENGQVRNPVLPPCPEIPVQMSPFGDERWELEIAENKRRKEIHREYVYNYRRPAQCRMAPQEQIVFKPEEPQPVVVSPLKTEVEAPQENERCATEREPIKKDYFKREPPVPKPKSLADLKFDTPNPPNLYPKFPEKTPKPEPVCDFQSNIRKFDRMGVSHYGVNVPFWQFSNKT